MALLAAMLVYFAAGLKASETSGTSSSASEDTAASEETAEPAALEESAAADTNESSETGDSQDEDGYVLSAESGGTPQTSSEGTFSSVLREPDQRTASESAGLFSRPDNSEEEDSSGSKISREEFDSLQNGMTYEEAVSAIGGPGTLQSGSGNMEIYKWSGCGSSGSFAELSFKSGKLAYKFQFGL